MMRHGPVAIAVAALGLISACSKPDSQALHKLACQQVANSIDLQSVSQLDLLRKALGVAPDVDPIGTCRQLGVTIDGGHGAAEQDNEKTP
mgnify:CR=1 FL=1